MVLLVYFIVMNVFFCDFFCGYFYDFSVLNVVFLCIFDMFL